MLTSPQRESYCLRRASKSRFFELNSHDPQSVQQLVDYLASLTKQEEAGEKTHHSE